ncbi:MAG: bifunctional UDP-sugar hydrolase/5'-nucleotidase [Eubacteriales bacterium]|nr:bifunctional UDP-sugar hydrolase/5'-nucleotidase [Eubacteriales bacterium]
MTCAVTLGIAAGSFSIDAMAQDNDIVILFTNDVHCAVDDNIGYAGLALYEQEMLKQTPYVTLVDAGDAVQGAPIGTLSEGSYIIDIMNELGYDVAIPGNHEFDYKVPRLLELNDKLECKYISSNFVNLKTGTTQFAPYKILDYGGTKVAYVGVTTPESFTKSTPAYFQDENGNYIYSFCEDSNGQRLYAQVQAAVDAARAEGAQYVVAVTHLGMNGVTPYWSAQAVIQNTNGIDALIDGHSHENYQTTYPNKDGKAVVTAQTGTKLESIGKMVIKPDGTITTEMVNAVVGEKLGPAAFVEGNDVKAVDPTVDAFIKNIQSQYSETLKQVIGSTKVDLTVSDPDTGKRAVRSAETNLGDLTADGYRAITGADIAFSNGGGIRASIKAGDITYNDALTVFPFGNSACMIEATGQQIKDALEMGARNLPEENGGFLQVSGLTYTVNTAIPSSVVTDEKGNFASVNGAYRVTDIMVGGQPLDLNKTYKLASHNYMLLSGGDGMTMFNGCKVLLQDVSVDVDVLYNYINKNLGGVVGEEYANPRGQGRIVIK